MSNYNILLGYTRAAYNGLNLMQVFTANSIMQRRLGPEAEIVMFTVPYQIPTEKTSPLNVMVGAYLAPFTMFVMVPLGIYVAYKIGQEKETGMKALLRKNGMNPVAHYLSWLLIYSFLNVIVTFIYALSLKLVVFEEDSFGLLFLLIFLGTESVFGLVWAVQSFTSTSKMAFFTFGFFYWFSYHASFLANQAEPVIETSVQQIIALAPVGAVKMTM